MDLSKLSEPTKNCPACRTPTALNNPECEKCGHHYPAPSVDTVAPTPNTRNRLAGPSRKLIIASSSLVLLALSIWIYVHFVVPPVCGYWYASGRG